MIGSVLSILLHVATLMAADTTDGEMHIIGLYPMLRPISSVKFEELTAKDVAFRIDDQKVVRDVLRGVDSCTANYSSSSVTCAAIIFVVQGKNEILRFGITYPLNVANTTPVQCPLWFRDMIINLYPAQHQEPIRGMLEYRKQRFELWRDRSNEEMRD